MNFEAQVRISTNRLPNWERRTVAEFDAEAVRGLIPAFEAKIRRVLARVWGANEDLATS
jgi:hypothetical protein